MPDLVQMGEQFDDAVEAALAARASGGGFGGGFAPFGDSHGFGFQ